MIKGQTKAMKLAERMAHHKVPGLSVAVINDGKLEWTRGYGVIEKDGDKPRARSRRGLATPAGT